MENLDKFNENEEEVTIPLKKEENSNNNKIDEEEFKRKKTKDFSFKQYNNRGLMMLEQKQKLDAQKEKLQDYVIQSKKIVDENEESESHMSDEQIFQLVDDFKKLAEEKKKVSETESDKKEKYHTVGKNNRGRGGRKNVSNDRNETNKRKQEAVEKQSKEKLRKQKEGKPEVQSKEVKEKQKEKVKEPQREKTAECPVCAQSLPLSAIEAHVEQCLASSNLDAQTQEQKKGLFASWFNRKKTETKPTTPAPAATQVPTIPGYQVMPLPQGTRPPGTYFPQAPYMMNGYPGAPQLPPGAQVIYYNPMDQGNKN